MVVGLCGTALTAQAPDPSALSLNGPTSIALPLSLDQGSNAVEQALRKLRTTASVLYIVAHPDDEDGSLLTYLSRGQGMRVSLFTLTRGEGGQNVMSADANDALGLIRTNELLKADEYYGVQQLWGTEADFGFSKTQQEAFKQWGHERVLYDAVLAVRRERPEVIVATFVGAVSDGHGQHQVSGEIAQEVFKAAADPAVFPDQLKPVSEGGLGLTPWQPLAVYSRTPFAQITPKGMFDYATGHWAPAVFKNYITGELTHGPLSVDATVPVGTRDPVLGRTYSGIAEQGWGMQKSQNGGANPSLPDPRNGTYHLWAVAPAARNTTGDPGPGDLFRNPHVNIDTSFAALTRFLPSPAPAGLMGSLRKIDRELNALASQCPCNQNSQTAQSLAAIYRQLLDLRSAVAQSTLNAGDKNNLLFELDAKSAEFQSALRQILGIEVTAFRTNESTVRNGGFRGNGPDETSASVSPGEPFKVRVHVYGLSSSVKLVKTSFESATGQPWQQSGSPVESGNPPVSDAIFSLTVPADTQPTKPYFTRPTIEQPYYDVSNPAWRGRSFAPWPLAASVELSFAGVPIRVREVVQSLQRVTGPGGFYEPLVVTPPVGVSVDPEARILPLDGKPLPITVVVHAQAAAEGSIQLELPANWTAEPGTATFHLTAAGDTEPMRFLVRATDGAGKLESIRAVVTCNGRRYTSGWRSIGYQGLRRYNLYKRAEMKTRKVDVRLAPGLRIGYVMGPGDLVPDAIQAMGVSPQLLSAADLQSGDLSRWNVIVVGIRAYSTRPDLAAAQPRLNDYVRNGGTLIVQYQSNNFPAPLALSLGRIPERVVDEDDPVKLLNTGNPLLNYPNKITAADFNGWVEERGHSFMDTWAPGFTALTETADPGQSPQRGGLLVAHPGKGTYVYVAYALYRQLPELVPGAYRILANLLSASDRHAPATDARQ
ncbi:MAG: PIG-L family deacetylase [Acidobacteriota bacterium]